MSPQFSFPHITMRHFFIFLFSIFAAVTATAQTASDTTAIKSAVTFGYFSYNEALQSMPEYAAVQKQMSELKAKYDAEAKRAEQEFNQKYEDFLAGQRDFPQTILEKRQAELQELMAKNVAFREESDKLLKAAEQDAYAPLHDKLDRMLKVIGDKEGFSFILNTDNHACPYVNAAQGRDINQLVKNCFR